MASQIVFFEKNKADFEQEFVTATASEGNDTATLVLNRSNLDAWATTGSADASNTTLEIDMVDTREINRILLLKHNFKAFTVEYWNGSAWANFSPAINQTTNTESGNVFEFETVFTTKVRLTVTGTHTPDDDKYLHQFIVTRLLGQLEGWPLIRGPKLDRDLRVARMLSGKRHVVESRESYSTRLEVQNWNIDSDLTLIETLYEMNEGFLFWPCGGDEDQFSTVRRGYRFEDIYLVRAISALSPELAAKTYKTGIKTAIDLAEVIT